MVISWFVDVVIYVALVRLVFGGSTMGISEPFAVLPGLAIVQRLSTQFFDESDGNGLNSLLNSLVVVSNVGVS